MEECVYCEVLIDVLCSVWIVIRAILIVTHGDTTLLLSVSMCVASQVKGGILDFYSTLIII